MLKQILFLTFLMLILLTTCEPAKPKDKTKETLSRLLKSTVVVELQDAFLTENIKVSMGSGFVVTDDGYIVTNYHVISDYMNMTEPEVTVTFFDGKEVYPTNIYASTKLDIALFKLNEKHLIHLDLKEEESEIGEIVYSVGYDYPFDFTVSTGILTHLSRKSDILDLNLIQSSLILHEGCSGSALIDKDGYVIGINQSVGKIGISLSIPSAYISKILSGEEPVQQYL